MSKVGTQVELDAALLERLDALASRTGRSRDDLIDDSVRRTLAANLLARVFGSAPVPTVELSDAAAEQLAYSELDAYRAVQDRIIRDNNGQ